MAAAIARRMDFSGYHCGQLRRRPHSSDQAVRQDVPPEIATVCLEGKFGKKDIGDVALAGSEKDLNVFVRINEGHFRADP